MDMQVFGDDLKKVLDKVPRPLVEKLMTVVSQHLAELAPIFPAIVDTMLPHILCAMPEKAMGTLDMNDVKTVVSAVFADYLADGFGGDKTPIERPTAGLLTNTDGLWTRRE